MSAVMNNYAAGSRTLLMLSLPTPELQFPVKLLLTSGVQRFGGKQVTRLYSAVLGNCLHSVKCLLAEGLDVNVGFCGFTPLYFAINNRNLEMVNLLITIGANVNHKTEVGFTPLSFAAHLGCIEIVRTLISSGADISHRVADRSTVLHFAVLSGNVDVVNALIKNSADVNAKNDDQMTPLHFACVGGHFGIAKALITSGAEVECLSATLPVYGRNKRSLKGIRALHLAAHYNHADIVILLLAAGAKVNSNGLGMMTSLHIAAYMGFRQIVDILLKAHADVNAKDRQGATPLHLAVESNEPKIVHFLLNVEGIDIDARIVQNTTALFEASQSGHLEIVKLLIKKKPDINAKCTDGLTPLLTAVDQRHVEVSKFLIQNGADIFETDKDGMTPLHYAACRGSLETAKALLAKGADLNSKTCNGRSALHLAVKHKQIGILDFLIESNADVNAKDGDYTPLHCAAYCGYLEAANYLLNNGANVNAKADRSRTPLHLASQYGHLEMVRLLLEKGADVNATEHENLSVLDIAIMNDDDKLVGILLEHGADARKGGMTSALHGAVGIGSLKVLKRFILNGNDINLPFENGLTLLHVGGFVCGRVDVVKFLISNGAYFDAKCNPNDALAYLTMKHVEQDAVLNPEVAEFLELTENLFKAVKKNCSVEVETCLTRGAFVDSRSVRFGTPLIYASWKGYVDVIDVLIKNGANVNITDNNNSSALHYAAKFSNLEVVYSLLRHGAVFNVCSTKGNKMPLDFARDAANDDIVHLLQQINGFFEQAVNGNNQIIKDLKEMKEENKMKFLAVLNARNCRQQTLIQVSLIHNNKCVGRSLCLLLSSMKLSEEKPVKSMSNTNK